MNLGKKKKSKKQPKLTKAEKLRINRLKRNASMAKKSSSQNTLRYTSLFENGLMHVVDNTYSRSYELGSANYVTALKDEQINIISSYNDTKKTKLDKRSIVYSTLGFGMMLYAFSSAGSLGFSSPVIICTLIISVLIIFTSN